MRLARPMDLRPVRARRLVAGGEAPCVADGDWLELSVDRVLDHEVLAIE